MHKCSNAKILLDEHHMCCLRFQSYIGYIRLQYTMPLWHSQFVVYIPYTSNQIKSLLLPHHHSTCALVSEILESVLQTVQKQFTYRQYILTDLSRKTMCRIHIHILSTHSVLFKTYLQLSIHVMHRMYRFYIMYRYIHTIVCEKKLQQIWHRPDMQCHGCALHGIQW